MRFLALNLILFALLAGCTSIEPEKLHEMPKNSHVPSAVDGTKWKMVSLVGWNDYLLPIYDNPHASKIAVNVSNVDFEKFIYVRAFLIVSESTDAVHLDFSSCNAIMSKFDRVGEEIKYRNHGQTEKACWEPVRNRSGETVYQPTPMFVDEQFLGLLPKITDYTVSSDGHILKLLGDDEQVLGVFKRQETAQ